jgi:hypothetical protein
MKIIENNKSEAFKFAQRKVKRIKSFYIHLSIYIVLNIYIGIQAYLDGGFDAIIENFIGMGMIWGVGVFIHWYNVLGKDFVFNKEWEKRKIKELINEDN